MKSITLKCKEYQNGWQLLFIKDNGQVFHEKRVAGSMKPERMVDFFAYLLYPALGVDTEVIYEYIGK